MKKGKGELSSFEKLLLRSLQDPEIKRAFDAEQARADRARKKIALKKSNAPKNKRAA